MGVEGFPVFAPRVLIYFELLMVLAGGSIIIQSFPPESFSLTAEIWSQYYKPPPLLPFFHVYVCVCVCVYGLWVSTCSEYHDLWVSTCSEYHASSLSCDFVDETSFFPPWILWLSVFCGGFRGLWGTLAIAFKILFHGGSLFLTIYRICISWNDILLCSSPYEVIR